MATAVFNSAESPSGGVAMPRIRPQSEPDSLLTFGSVRTVEEQPQAIDLTYRFPGLSGMGRIPFGLTGPAIRWECMFIADTLANLWAFEAKIRKYLARGGRFILVSELGQTWNYAELVGYQPKGPPTRHTKTAVAFDWVREATVIFRDMQPS